MGQTFSAWFSLLTSKRETRTLVLGLDACGKTTLLNFLKLGEICTTIPTIGFNVETVEYKRLKFTMWDVGGQTRLRPLWRYYTQGSDVLLWMVDSADRERVGESARELHSLLEQDELRNATLLVLANKQDLPNAMPISEIQERMKLRDLHGRKWFVQGCSITQQGRGVYEGLDWVAANLPPEQKK